MNALPSHPSLFPSGFEISNKDDVTVIFPSGGSYMVLETHARREKWRENQRFEGFPHHAGPKMGGKRHILADFFTKS
jgi:hypothetical protein